MNPLDDVKKATIAIVSSEVVMVKIHADDLPDTLPNIESIGDALQLYLLRYNAFHRFTVRLVDGSYFIELIGNINPSFLNNHRS